MYNRRGKVLSVGEEGDQVINALLGLLLLVEREGGLGELPLARLQVQHLLLHCVLDHKSRDRHGLGLANSVHAVNGLFLN